MRGRGGERKKERGKDKLKFCPNAFEHLYFSFKIYFIVFHF